MIGKDNPARRTYTAARRAGSYHYIRKHALASLGLDLQMINNMRIQAYNPNCISAAALLLEYDLHLSDIIMEMQCQKIN